MNEPVVTVISASKTGAEAPGCELRAWKSIGWMPQKEPGLFSVRLLVVGGRLTAAHLAALAGIADRFGRGVIHLTTRQGAEIPYVKGADREKLLAALAEAGLETGIAGPCLRTLTACQGGLCRHGHYDPQALAARIEARFHGRAGLPHKFKIGLAGCANGCTKPIENDLGIAGAVEQVWEPELCTACGLCVGACPAGCVQQNDPAQAPTFDPARCVHCGRCSAACPSSARRNGRTGYVVYVGGMMGAVPHLGHKLGGIVYGAERLLEIAERLLDFYARHGQPGERFARTVDRVGLAAVSEAVNDAFSGA